MSISIARSPGWERDPSGNIRWVPEDIVRRILPAPLELTEDEVESDRTYALHGREWYEWWWSQQALLRVAVQPEASRADAPRRNAQHCGHCGAVNAHSTEWCLGQDERKHAAMRQQAQLNADAMVERGLAVPPPNAAPSLAEVVLNRALFDRWHEAMRGDCSEKWWIIRGYHFDRLAEHFGNLAAVANESRHSEYNASALARCSAATLRLGTLRSFTQWCKGQGWGFTPPEIEGPTKKQRGTRDPNRKGAAVELSSAEVEALIAHLPEQTSRPRRKGAALRPIRDAVLVEWDTGLRPSTIERLRVPDHWQPQGPGELFIAAGIDKEEYERTLPLTPRLAALLARRAAALPDGKGLLLASTNRRCARTGTTPIEAGIDERRARKISVYDVRHAAAKCFFDATGNVRGTAFMLGHRNATGSTHRYTRPDKPAADLLVHALARRNASASKSPAASMVVAPSASPPDALDSTQARDYSSVPPREGGGIGRRTSLRC
jgi:site-specific recombinase XerC